MTVTREANHETRARQLLTLRYSRATPRFETMLQGTRRAPQGECMPVFGVSSERSSFFRSFSTQSRRSVVAVSA